MHRVGRMVSDHVKPLTRKGSLVSDKHSPHVLIVPPSKAKLVEATLGLVHTALRVVLGIAHVRIELVKGRKDDGIVWNPAANNKCVTTKSPLLAFGAQAVLSVFSIAPEKHDLAHVVKETSELEPVGVSSLANALGCLEQVELIGELQIGIGSVLP